MRTHFLLLFAITICIALGCQPDKPESATKGNLHVLISESDAPALVEQVNAFMGIYGKNGANVTYSVTSSDEAINKLINDTIRCIFTTRPLTADERKTFDANPKELVEIVVAYDGLAAVVHHKNPIEQMTTKEVEGILKGTITRWEQLSHSAKMKGRIELFMQDSSDVTMFLQKRILHGASLNKATHRTRSSLQTLQSVVNEPLSLGFVGVDWIDSAKVPAKVLEIAETDQKADTTFKIPMESVGKFYPPHPAHVYRSYYPFKRAIYLYVRSRVGTVSSGFSSYVANKDGQQIFLRRKLVPGTQPIRLRPSE